MKFCLDRYEENFAVCLSEDEATQGETFNFDLEKNEILRSAGEGMIFEAASVEDGVLRDVRLLTEETEARRARAKSRLSALFNRRK